MSRIISYPYDSTVVDDDAWIGTEASTTRTKQYTASAVADYLNINGKISIGGQLAYQYVVDPLQAAGTFSITSGGLDNVPFANITALTLSMTDRGGQNVVAFLNYLVGSDILISKQNEISSFGHYEVVSYNVNPNDSQFYDLVVVFKGGNGSMNFLDFYDAINFTLASEIVGSYTFNVDSDNGAIFTVQNNDTIDFTSTNITVSNVNSAISFNLPATGVTAGAYTTANITVDSFGRITAAADGTSGPGGTGTTNFVTKWVNATTLGDSVIFDNGTNVGIGTTSPTTPLHINAAAPTIRLQDSTSADNHYLVGNNGELRIQSTGFMTVRPGNITSAIFLANGNVGIGTTAPSGKLDVSGNIRLVNTGDYIKFANDFVTLKRDGANFMSLNAYAGFKFFDTQASSERVRIDGSGNVGIGTTSPLTKLHVAGGVRVDDDVTFTGTGFIRNNTNELEIESVGGKNLILTPGSNVGIGTSSPSVKLDIAQSADNQGIKISGFDDQSSSNLRLYTSNFGNNEIISSNALRLTSGASAILKSTGSYLRLQAGNTNNQIQVDFNYTSFNSGGSEVMRIEGVNQRVGIGTTSPAQKFHLSGGIARFNNVSSNYLDIDGSNANTNHVIIQNRFNQIQIKTNSGVSAPHISLLPGTGGNVGIGTGSPNARLTVKGSSLASEDLFHIEDSAGVRMMEVSTDPAGNAAIQVKDTTGTTKTLLNSAGNTYFNGGNVGIGTTTPTEKLEVIGKAIIRRTGTATAHSDTDLLVTDATAAGSTAQLEILGGNLGNSFLYFSDTDSYQQGGIQYQHTSDTMKFRVNASTAVSINSSRNVGIGTTSPLNKLQVSNGSVGIDSQYMIRDNRNNTILLQSLSTAASNRTLTIGNATYNNIVIPNGKAGIGTTTPHRKLTVTGADGSAPLLALKNTSTSTSNDVSMSFIRDNDDSKGFTIGINSANDAFNISKSGSIVSTDVKLTIADDGNVGIGTTSPQAKLHVDGAIKVGTAQTLAASSTTVGAIRYRATTGASYMEMVMQTGVSGVIPVFAWVIIKENNW